MTCLDKASYPLKLVEVSLQSKVPWRMYAGSHRMTADDMSSQEAMEARKAAGFTKGNTGKGTIAGIDCLWEATIALFHPQHIDDNTH